MSVKKTALATTANFETRHGVATGTDTSLIELLINAATDWIEGNTDRKLKARNYNGFGTAFEHKTSGSGDMVDSENYVYFSGNAEQVDENGNGVLFLPQYPVLFVHASGKDHLNHKNAVAFVLEELDSRSSGDGEVWTALVRNDDYIVDQETGIITFLTRRMLTGTKNYRVTMTAGFSENTAQPYVPDDLQDVCLYIAGKLYREDMDKKSERDGSSSTDLIAFEDDKYVQLALTNYRKL